jgi:hypothetical protein
MNSRSKTHEELLLGDSLQVILDEERRALPVISEYQFQREVLDILENPFGKEALRHFAAYVGELTKPLNVVANDNRDQVLFTVPALVQTPVTTIAYGSGMTAEGFMRTLNRDMELGGKRVNDKIHDFMMRMTQRPNYLETVIYPMQAILSRYGRRMVDLPGVPSPSGETATASPTGAPTNTSSFSDEYED